MNLLLLNFLFVTEFAISSQEKPRINRFGSIPDEWHTFKTHLKTSADATGVPDEWDPFHNFEGYMKTKWHRQWERREFGGNREELRAYDNKRFLPEELKKNGFAQLAIQHDNKTERLLQSQRNQQLMVPLCYDEMLAVIVYTGDNPAYVDLRQSERKGNYTKWYQFGINLNSAIFKLMADKETKYPLVLYHGMHNVGFPEELMKYNQVLDTFTSFTEVPQVAINFAKNNGVIFKYHPQPIRTVNEKYYGLADISWISEFPNEKEWLLARGHQLKPISVKIEELSGNKTLQRIEMVAVPASGLPDIHCNIMGIKDMQLDFDVEADRAKGFDQHFGNSEFIKLENGQEEEVWERWLDDDQRFSSKK